MKTCLIIGAGPGIGIETARRFAGHGYHLVLASRTGRSISSQIADLQKSGATVEIETVDAADPAAVDALVRRHSADLEILHYNAAAFHYSPAGQLELRTLADESIESLMSDTNTNLVSALAAIKAAAGSMAPRRAGTILLTGGGLGIDPNAAFLTLSVGKAGLRAAAKALFEPMQRQNIHLATVTVRALVSPGSAKAAEVADAFLHLHQQPRDEWAWELVVT